MAGARALEGQDGRRHCGWGSRIQGAEESISRGDGWRFRAEGEGEQGVGGGGVLQGVGTLIARGKVGADRDGFIGRQDAHLEQSEIVFRNVLKRHHADITLRRVVTALRILVLTVPSGRPVRSAISVWVRPSKKAIWSASRCSPLTFCIA